MIKKISCRVVDSVPLDKNSGTLRYETISGNRYHKTGNTQAETFRPRDISNSENYTYTLGTTRLFIDNNSMGQTLDCYA